MNYGFLMMAAAGRVEPPPPVDDLARSVAQKIVSWWDFDDNLEDAFGDNSLAGSVSYAPGHIGQKAIKGSRLVKSGASLPNIQSSTGAMSFGGWVYIAGTGGEDIELRFGMATSGQRYRIAFRNGNQVYLIAGPDGQNTTINSPSGAISVGNYYFVVATLIASTGDLRLYLDGELIAQGIRSSSFPYADTISFGRVAGNVFSALHNDSSFIADGALTPEEVQWLYNNGAGRSSADIPYEPVSRGAWTWFNDPRAIRVGGKVVAGYAANDGSVKVAEYDEASGNRLAEYSLLAPGAVNDHDNPALLQRGDGFLLATFTRHNASNYWSAVSTSPGDASSWGASEDIGPQLGTPVYSYANLFQLPDEGGRIFNFYRGGLGSGWGPHYSVSDDGGDLWSAGQQLATGGPGGRPYLKAARNGDGRIDFIVTDGHPDTVTNNSVRHFYYEGGAWFNSAGNSIGLPPFDTTSDLTTVYDGTPARGWIWDIQIGADGHPRVALSTYPSTTDHRYHYARWTGSAWVTSEICAAGTHLYAAEPYYSGGFCIDPDDVNTVYSSREIGGVWRLYRYRTTDGGATWSGQDLGLEGIRPYAVAGSQWLFYVSGRYGSYTDYSTILSLAKK